MARQLAIIVPSGQPADEFRSVFRQWSQTGLLGPSAVLLDDPPDRPQLRTVSVELHAYPSHEADTPHRATLEDALGPRFDLIRLIMVQLVTAEPHPSVFHRADQLRQLLNEHVGSTPMVFLNVIVPATSAEAARPLSPAENLLQGWNANVLVSPEDRVTPDAVNRGVRDDQLPGHAALAVSVAGAIWRGVEVGPFDGPDERANPVPTLRLMRTFAAVVDGDPIVDHLADNVLLLSQIGDGHAWPEPADPVTLEQLPQLPRDQVSARIDALASHALGIGAGALCFTDISPPLPPERPTLSISEAVRLYARYVVGRAVALPGEMGRALREDTKRSIEDIVTGRLFGQDSEVVVTFGGRPRPGSAPPFSFDHQQMILQQAQQVLGEVPDPPFYPEVWRELRDVSFSLVDGGTLPDGWPWRQIQGETPVVTWPGEIAPHPRSRLTVGVSQLDGLGLNATEPVTIGAADALTAFRFVSLLRDAQRRPPSDRIVERSAPPAPPPVESVPPIGSTTPSDGLEAPAEVPLVVIGDERPLTMRTLDADEVGGDDELVVHIPSAFDEEGSEATGSVSDGNLGPDDALGGTSDWPTGASDTSVFEEPLVVSSDAAETAPTPYPVDPLAGLESSLVAWASERRGSFMYRVAERSAVEISRAETAMQEALALLADLPKDPAPLQHDRVGRRLLFGGSLAFIVMAVLGWRHLLGLTVAIALPIGAVILLACVIGGVYRAYSKINEHFRALYRRPPAATVAQWALDRLRNAVNELARLQNQYRVLMEWSEIVGYFLHEPYKRPDGDEAADPFRRLEQTPDAVTIVKAGRSDGRLAGLTNRMRNMAFEQLWMHRLYDDVEQAMLGLYKEAAGLPPEVSPRLPADDTGARTQNSRSFLLDILRNGTAGGLSWDEMVEQITKRLGELPLRELFDTFDHDGTRTTETSWGRNIDSIESLLGGLVPGASIDPMVSSVLNEEGRILVGTTVASVYLALPEQLRPPTDKNVQVTSSFAGLRAGTDFWTVGLRADLTLPFNASSSKLFAAGHGEPAVPPVTPGGVIDDQEVL